MLLAGRRGHWSPYVSSGHIAMLQMSLCLSSGNDRTAVGIAVLGLGWTARADFREPTSSLMCWCLGPKFHGSQGSWSSRLTTCLLQAIAPAPGSLQTKNAGLSPPVTRDGLVSGFSLSSLSCEHLSSPSLNTEPQTEVSRVMRILHNQIQRVAVP